MACVHAAQRAAASLAGGCSTSNSVESLAHQTPYDCWTTRRRIYYASRSQRQLSTHGIRQLTRYSQTCVRSPVQRRSRTRLTAVPIDDEEAQLTADYGALSERLEVSHLHWQ